MDVRALMRKINDAVRPIHLKNEKRRYDPVDARVTARSGNVGGAGAPMAPAGTWVPSQQDEAPPHH